MAVWTFSAAFLLIGNVTHQGAMDRPFSLVLPAAPVPRIVEALSKATGVPMAATGVLAKDVVVLDIHDKPLSEVMKRLAEVTDGTWKNDKGTYRLNRTAAAERAQEARERKLRADEVASEIARSKEIRDASLTADEAKTLAASFKKLKEKNPNYSFDSFGALDGPLNKAPARRALLRIIASLDMSEISMLFPGDRIVYSNKPTPVQRHFPAAVDGVLSRYMQEQNFWADAVLPQGDSAPGRFAGDPLEAREVVSQSPDRFILIANRSNSSAPVQFRLLLVSDSKTIGEASAWIGSDAIRQFSRDMMNGAVPSGTKIVLRPESKTMLDATKGFQRQEQGPLPGPSAEAVALLTNPEKLDPLSFVATDGFVSVADARNDSLIASLPDELVALNFMPTPNGQTIDGFMRLATGIGDLQVTDKDGWLTVSPFRPYSARVMRVDRNALGKYLRGIASDGRASLDSQAEFALNAQPTDYDTYGMPMGMLIDMNSTQNVDRDWVTLKLWATLTSEQRGTLMRGQKLPFKNLSPLQLGFVEREAYNRSFKGFHSARGGAGVTDIHLMMEPTECLPNGLPSNGYLSLSVQNSTAILASSSTKNVRLSYARIFDEHQLGSTLAYYENNQNEKSPMFDHFQLIQRANYTLTYQYNEAISDAANFHDILVPANSLPMTFSELPKEMQAKVLAAKEQAKSNGNPGQDRRTVPPQQ